MIETERLYRESIERDKVAKAERDRPRIEAPRPTGAQKRQRRPRHPSHLRTIQRVPRTEPPPPARSRGWTLTRFAMADG